MKIAIKNLAGKNSGELEVKFALIENGKGTQAVHDTVVAHNAAQRSGTACTKTVGDVQGSNKKPWKQKGTGRARAGSVRSPLWAGGGVVFGPKPRDYSKKINDRVKSLAFRRALFERASAGEIAVIDGFSANPVKTKVVNQVVGRIAPKGRVLLVDAPFAADTMRATRNLSRVFMQDATQLNPWDLAQYRKIIVSSKALVTILSRAKEDKTG